MICSASKKECVHFVSDDTDVAGGGPYCNGAALVLTERIETCPCPSKIQAPKKDPLEECAKELDARYLYAGSQEAHEKEIHELMEILKAHWPKKGDVDKAWAWIESRCPNDGHDSYGTFRGDFERALKEGGFDVA